MKTKYAIAALITALAVILVAQLASPGGNGRGFLEAAFLLSMLLMVMAASRFAKGHWVTGAGPRPHDEFERQVMDRAGARAHRVMLLLLAAVFAWLVVAGLSSAPMPGSAGDWATLGLSLLGIGIALPALFAEQVSPTADAEADEDPSA